MIYKFVITDDLLVTDHTTVAPVATLDSVGRVLEAARTRFPKMPRKIRVSAALWYELMARFFKSVPLPVGTLLGLPLEMDLSLQGSKHEIDYVES